MSGDAATSMPVLRALERDFSQRTPLAGLRVTAALNVTGESAQLARVLLASAARLLIVSSKATTFDERAAREMVKMGAEVLPNPVVDTAASADAVLTFAPDLVIDNGDLALLWSRSPSPPTVLGGTVHSQNAVKKVRAVRDELPFPLISIAASPLKTAVETTHGTGLVALREVLNAGVHLAGKEVLVVGFGVTGRAVAEYLKACHCRISVAEVDAIAALRATYEGYRLVALDEGLPTVDVVITVTDDEQVLTLPRLRKLKDGAVVGGIGHSPEEIDRIGLERAATARMAQEGKVDYVLDGRRLALLEGPGHNPVFAGINPPEMMDISLALHALCLDHFASAPDAARELLPVPAKVDVQVARLKLAALGLKWGPQ